MSVRRFVGLSVGPSRVICERLIAVFSSVRPLIRSNVMCFFKQRKMLFSRVIDDITMSDDEVGASDVPPRFFVSTAM